MPFPRPVNESERLAALRSFNILDSAPEQAFNDIVELASTICNTPIALVSFVDEGRQWFKARVGLSIDETSRDISFCTHAMLEQRVMTVPDATSDARFRFNPLVQQHPYIRFYAGAPLFTSDGHALGTLCVLDHKPNELSQTQERSLKALAHQVMNLLELRLLIADYQKMEMELRKSEERYKAVVENLKEVVFQTDADGRWVFLNLAWTEVMEYSVEESLGTLFLDYVHPEDRELNLERFRPLVEGKKDYCRHEIRYQTKSGATRWVEVFARLTKAHDGTTLGTTGTLTDITQRKESEAVMQMQRNAIESAMDGMAILDERGEFVYLNKAHLQLFGYEEMHDLVGHSWRELYDVEEIKFIEEKIFPILMRDGKWNGEAIARQRDGTLFFEGLSLTLIEGGKRLVCICRDVSPQKNAEMQLTQTADALRRSNRELEQFAYVASHDLQEPLRMVTNYVQLLERRYKGQLDSSANEFIGYAVEGAERMRSLVTGLLTFSRVGTNQAHHSPVSTHDVLKRTLNDLQVSLDEAGAQLSFDPLPFVIAEETQLRQLFQNLIANAIKFRKRSTPPRIHISARRQGDASMWQFSVTDNGIGIEQKFAPRIFDLFQRLHTREEYPGTGIGLAVCKKIVEGLGGRIWVESEPEKGATFYFTLQAMPENQ